MGLFAGVPALLGFLTGRYYLPYALAFLGIYQQQLVWITRGSNWVSADAALGLMALLMAALTMSVLSQVCRLRTNPAESGTY